jgi:hypothetical protein
MGGATLHAFCMRAAPIPIPFQQGEDLCLGSSLYHQNIFVVHGLMRMNLFLCYFLEWEGYGAKIFTKHQ